MPFLPWFTDDDLSTFPDPYFRSEHPYAAMRRMAMIACARLRLPGDL